MTQTMNKNITEIKEISSPNELLSKYTPTQDDCDFIAKARADISDILHGRTNVGENKRFLVIVGPCSIHEYDSALEYAKKLVGFQQEFPHLYIVMRVYFEKPRSRTGWKGFIYDPDLDNSFQINKGLDLARKLMLEITKMRIPIGSEFLDTITPQYLADLVSWGAIGARTSESQIHRQLASGVSMPIGFKNLTSGDYEKAIDGILSANYPHNFLGVDETGKACHVITKGNMDGHLILRGGDVPNYQECCIEAITSALRREKIPTGIIVDCSHGNSQKEYNRQILVALYIRRLCASAHKYPIRGIMLESNFLKGKQDVSSLVRKKGMSVTDGCIDIYSTQQLLKLLNSPTIADGDSIVEVRTLIRTYDTMIYRILQGEPTLDISLLDATCLLEEDAALYELCKGNPLEELLLMACSTRLSFSNRISELKLRSEPFLHMLKTTDLLKLITHRDIESEIMESFKDPIYLKLIELSKNIQVRCLEKFTKTFRIGYLFGKGTFSHESITKNFRGTHISYPDISSLYSSLRTGEVDAILLPTYNSIIGEIFPKDVEFDRKGTIDHPIELSLYSNRPIRRGDPVDILYVETHVQRECQSYIEKYMNCATIVLVKSSVEGCFQCVQHADGGKTVATLSSTYNSSVMLHTIDTNIVEHNITTFSFLTTKKLPKTPPYQVEVSYFSCIDSHFC